MRIRPVQLVARFDVRHIIAFHAPQRALRVGVALAGADLAVCMLEMRCRVPTLSWGDLIAELMPQSGEAHRRLDCPHVQCCDADHGEGPCDARDVAP